MQYPHNMAEKQTSMKETLFISEERKKELSNLIEENEPKSAGDLLVLVVHAVMLKSGFKMVCVGRYGENQDLLVSEGGILPSSWNKQKDPKCYNFSYSKVEEQSMHDLKGVVSEGMVGFTLLERGKNCATVPEVNIVVNDHVTQKDKPITYDWLLDTGNLWKLIENGLFGMQVDPFEKRGEEECVKPMELKSPRLEIERTQNLLLHDNISIQHPNILRGSSHFERPSPFAYGDADRLPGHPGFGGMMMDPLRSGGMGLRPPSFPGMPRGSVPPGARFDPFSPLTEFNYRSGDRNPSMSFDPNPDHLRRPGFNEDMFM